MIALRGCAVAAIALLVGTAAVAQAKPPARTALKVCQDPNNLPFSDEGGHGIENRIAEVFGKALNMPVQYYSFPNRMNFIRNTLRFKLPGEDYRCDIVMAVPLGFDQASVTRPYYRSTYALVFADGKGLDKVMSAEDFLALGPEKLSKLRIGLYDKSPGADWLLKHQLLESAVPYPIMNANPEQYPGEIIQKDLAGGKIDVAIVWGPIAGYFAKQVKSPVLHVVPLHSEPGVRFDYEMAMGVRYGEPEWKKQVEALIDAKRPEIIAILKEYNVPLVDDSYAAQQPK